MRKIIKHAIWIAIIILFTNGCKTTASENTAVEGLKGNTDKTVHLRQQNFVSLLEMYQNGPIYLVPDSTYARNMDWDKLFDRYFDTINFNDDGYRRKNIALAPDGTIFMSQRNRHEIWKFDPDGQFVMRIGEKGGKPHQFPMLPSIQDVIGNKYFVTTDVHARVKVFDFDGNLVSHHTLGYMGSLKATVDGKLMASGSVIWRNKGWRSLITVMDIKNWEEKTLHAYFRDPNGNANNYAAPRFVYRKENGKRSVKVEPSTQGKVYLPAPRAFRQNTILLKSGNFIIANKATGVLDYYNQSGGKVNSFKLNIDPIVINNDDVQDNYRQAQAYYKSTIARIDTHPKYSREQKDTFINAYKSEIEKSTYLSDSNNYHPTLPYFSTILTDYEENLLVFEFTRKQEADNRFNVVAYQQNGEILARTSFICNGYELSFVPSRFIVTNGYVYAIAYKIDAEGVPIRLVRFRMMTNNAKRMIP